jgi:Uma2 family endonuclease
MSRVTLAHTKFTTDEFVRMVDADVFGTNRVELIHGRVYFMSQKASHLWAVSKGMRALLEVKPANEWLMCQGTLKLDLYTMPDPDFLWMPCPEGTPVAEWPEPLLLIEIADSTYRRDSGIKLRKYAFHGIDDYWIENLKENRIEVMRGPRNPTGRLKDCHYDSITHYEKGQSINLLKRPEVSIKVDDLLP